MEKQQSPVNLSCGGQTAFGTLFLIFLVLKLTGTGPIGAWSWWLVTMPLWIPIVLVGVGGFLLAVVGGILTALAIRAGK